MASKLVPLLSLALIIHAYASPVPSPQENELSAPNAKNIQPVNTKSSEEGPEELEPIQTEPADAESNEYKPDEEKRDLSDISKDNTSTVTSNSDGLLEIIEVIETVLVPVNANTSKTEDETKDNDDEHTVEKRSILRGDNPENDLLAGFEGLKYESEGLSSITGRRIKFLPTFLG